MRRREVSPLELTEHYLERADRLDSVGAFVTLTPERARRARGRSRRSGRGARPALRRADGDQGPQPHRRGAHDLRLGGVRRLRARRLRRRHPLARGRRPGQPRQDQHPGVRVALLHRARRRAAGGHAVGPHPHGRRLVRGSGGRGRRRAGAARPGLRRRRLDPDPGLLLRAGRPQAHARADQRSPHVRRPGGSGDGRADRPHGRATRRRCSTCSPVVGWEIRPGRHLRPRRSWRRRDRDPGRLRIARFITPVITDVAGRPRVRARPGRTPPGCSSRSATRSRTSRCRCRPRRSPSSRPAGRC